MNYKGNFKLHWDEIFKKYYAGTIREEYWIEGIVMDLGCGMGGNTLHLLRYGKRVVACDLSSEALKIFNKHFPKVLTKQFDMSKGFPFDDNSISIVVADLCVHYFSFENTEKILNELRRVLVNEGYLMFRVNSTNDYNCNLDKTIEIEKNYYKTNDIDKRLFDEKDLKEFFKDWNIMDLKEETTLKYDVSKTLWVGLIKNKK